MERDNKQEYSLEKTVEILAEMTKKDIQKLDNPEDFSDTKLSLPMKAPTSYPLYGFGRKQRRVTNLCVATGRKLDGH